MTIARSAITIAAFISVCAWPAFANADYRLGTIVNKTDQPISIASIVRPGGATKQTRLGSSDHRMGIVVPKVGVLTIDEGPKCPGLTWAIALELNDRKWGVGYEGEGVINITINADYSVTIGAGGTPGGNGTVFPGGC